MPSIEIRRFARPGIGSVNSFAIDLPGSVILIDGQRELSSARQALTDLNPDGKPISAVFLTHPHPDHFGGIGVFVEAGKGCPYYASQQTHDSIAEDRMGFIAKSREVVGDDFPETVTLPNRILTPNQSVAIEGLTIETREMGEGESECMTVLHLPESGDLFPADIIQHRMTAFLLEGRLEAWLDQIEALRRDFPEVRTIHAGHGASGTPEELLSCQQTYLETFKRFVAEEIAEGELIAGAAERITSRMQEVYPEFEPVAAIPDLLELNIAPVAKAIGDEA